MEIPIPNRLSSSFLHRTRNRVGLYGCSIFKGIKGGFGPELALVRALGMQELWTCRKLRALLF